MARIVDLIRRVDWPNYDLFWLDFLRTKRRPCAPRIAFRRRIVNMAAFAAVDVGRRTKA